MQSDKDKTIQIKRLSSDTDYFNNVFKKTEKIVSVTLYILSETKCEGPIQSHLDQIKDKAIKTHELSLKTLALRPYELSEGLMDFQYTLVALESGLRVAQMAGVIQQDLFMLLADQLDAVMRYLNNHYLQADGMTVSEFTAVAVPKAETNSASTRSRSSSPSQSRQKRVTIPAGDISTDAYLVYSQLTDRAERIKTVLEAKPQATVKDISEVITDVSEKTIQRELNSLIEKGQVVREGERRWSRYSVKK